MTAPFFSLCCANCLRIKNARQLSGHLLSAIQDREGYLRRDRHKALNPRILKHRKRHNQPKTHRQAPNRPQLKHPRLHTDRLIRAAHVPLPGRMVRDLVRVAEVAVEDDERDGAEEGEEGDDGGNPERPGV